VPKVKILLTKLKKPPPKQTLILKDQLDSLRKEKNLPRQFPSWGYQLIFEKENKLIPPFQFHLGEIFLGSHFPYTPLAGL